jgi:deoxyadenosine/deoxycytidine kinase
MEDETPPRRVIAFEGDIGVGKSTLCNKLKTQFPQSVAIYREQTNELFLQLFYSNAVSIKAESH